MNKKNPLENHLSVPRLKPYLDVCNGNFAKGLEFYQLNMRLSASFLPLLSILEVSLRNAIDRSLMDFFNTYDWRNNFQELLYEESYKKVLLLEKKYEEQLTKDYKKKELLYSTAEKLKNHHRSLIREEKNILRINIKIRYRKKNNYKKLNDLEKLRYIEQKLEKELQTRHITIPKSQLIATMPFAFWTSLFRDEITRVLKDSLSRIFSEDYIKNMNVYSTLNSIRLFRNRVAHNEPLCFKYKYFNIDKVKKVNMYIGIIIKSLDKDLYNFSKSTFTIHRNMLEINDFIENLPQIINYDDNQLKLF
ncbi:MAG: hypothetical protein AAF849_12085 [Bacteroidota bacterium]